MQPFSALIVEDFRRFLRLALQEKGQCQVIAEAADGLEAIQKAEELQPDLILLDIGLPDLNGLGVAKRVRKLVPAATILIVKPRVFPRGGTRSFQLTPQRAGFLGSWLAKPFV